MRYNHYGTASKASTMGEVRRNNYKPSNQLRYVKWMHVRARALKKTRGGKEEGCIS